MAPGPPDPYADPKFQAVVHQAGSAAATAKQHPSAGTEVNKAKAAAVPPSNDRDSQAKAARADTMAAAKPGGFDKAAFVAAVRKAIADAAPKNLDEADKFASSGKAEGIKNTVMSTVTTGKQGAAGPVDTAAKQPPDPSVATVKQVTPLADPKPGAVPAVNGQAAMPSPAPAEQLDLRAGPAQVDAQMKEGEVTDAQLTNSNEPSMRQAVDAKRDAQAHADAAPSAIRAQETTVLSGARAQAGAVAATGVTGLTQARDTAAAGSHTGKADAKGKDEAARAKLSADINRIFDAAKTDVDAILGGVDDKVGKEFDAGATAAHTAFTANHQAAMDRYKDERYSGVSGAVRWTEDLFTGLPAEANQIYDRAKARFETDMTAVISRVADVIARELDAAKARIDKGRADIKALVAAQPASLQTVAAQAAREIGTRFDQLDSDVASKQESLVSDLADRYTQARGEVDDEIKAEQAKNQGLVDKAVAMVGSAVETIKQLKALFTGLLARAAPAFTKILDDPVGFIGNFVGAVKQGFLNFAGNILEHLKKGLLGWLFGALADAGIELPDSFDLKGIMKLVGSILGLTWANIKSRIAKLSPGLGAVIDVVESKVEVFSAIARDGLAGAWNWIKDKLGDLKEMILTPIKDFIIEKIVKAGISWLIGLLNPAGALVKIVQAIVGIVQWISERGAALMELISTIVDAISDIAGGGTGGVPAKIESALGKTVPLVISFLANLLGLGGISEKIRSIIAAVQAPVNKAIDWVIKLGLKLAGPLIRAATGIANKVKGKVLGGDDSPQGKQQRLDKGMAAGVGAVNRFSGKKVGETLLRPVLGAVRMRYGLGTLEPVRQGVNWAVHGEVQRVTVPTQAEVKGGKDVDFNAPPATDLRALGLSASDVEHIFAQSSADKIKSAIMEALLAKREGEKSQHTPGPLGGTGSGSPAGPATTGPGTGHPAVPEFIAGKRITNSAGKEFSDGILAELGVGKDGRQPTVRVVKIFEAKASSRQMYKLTQDADRYSRISEQDKKNIRAEVLEDLVAKNYPDLQEPAIDAPRSEQAAYARAFADAKAKTLASVGAQQLDALMKKKAEQVDTGQLVRDKERLSPNVDSATGGDIPTILVIDSVARTVVGYTPTIPIEAVLPHDVEPGKTVPGRAAEQRVDLTFSSLPITAGKLSQLAAAVRSAQS